MGGGKWAWPPAVHRSHRMTAFDDFGPFSVSRMSGYLNLPRCQGAQSGSTSGLTSVGDVDSQNRQMTRPARLGTRRRGCRFHESPVSHRG